VPRWRADNENNGNDDSISSRDQLYISHLKERAEKGSGQLPFLTFHNMAGRRAGGDDGDASGVDFHGLRSANPFRQSVLLATGARSVKPSAESGESLRRDQIQASSVQTPDWPALSGEIRQPLSSLLRLFLFFHLLVNHSYRCQIINAA
jgi:hypothetical protein